MGDPEPRRSDSGSFGSNGLSDRVVRFFAGPPGWLDGAPMTRLLVWANVLVFAGELLHAHTTAALFDVPLATLLRMGANYAPATVLEGRVETLLTACFLHGSLLHIVFNMFALRNVGPLVERAVGSSRFLLMTLVAGMAGSGASAGWAFATNPERVSVGASGAICGVIGATLVLGWRVQGFRGPLTQAMLRWFAFMAIVGFFATRANLLVDNAAHAGGAFTGVIVAVLWRRRTPSRTLATVFDVASILLVAGSALLLVARTRSDPFASMRATDRFRYAVVALEGRRCAEATRGYEAASRLHTLPKVWVASADEIRDRRSAFADEERALQTLGAALAATCPVGP